MTPRSVLKIRAFPDAPPDHRLVAHKRATLAQLCDAGLTGREEGAGRRLILEERLAGKGVSVRQSVTLGSNEAIKQAVAAGFGCAVVSRNVLSGSDAMVVLPVAGFPIRSHWHVVHAHGVRLSLAAGAFIGFVREPGRNLDNTGLSKTT